MAQPMNQDANRTRILFSPVEIANASSRFFERYSDLGEGTLELLRSDIDVDFYADEPQLGDPGVWLEWIIELWAEHGITPVEKTSARTLILKDNSNREATATVHPLGSTVFEASVPGFVVGDVAPDQNRFSEAAAFTVMSAFVSHMYSMNGASLERLLELLATVRRGDARELAQWTGLLV